MVRADFALLCTVIGNRISDRTGRPYIRQTDQAFYLTPDIRRGIENWSHITGTPFQAIHQPATCAAGRFEQLLTLATKGSNNEDEAIAQIDALAANCLEQSHADSQGGMNVVPALLIVFLAIMMGGTVLAFFLPLFSSTHLGQ